MSRSVAGLCARNSPVPRSFSPTMMLAPTAVEIVIGTITANGANRNTDNAYAAWACGLRPCTAALADAGNTSRVVDTLATIDVLSTWVTIQSRPAGATMKKNVARISIGIQ